MNRCWWFEHISTGIDNAAIYDIPNQSSVKTCQGNLPKDSDSKLGREGNFFLHAFFFSL